MMARRAFASGAFLVVIPLCASACAIGEDTFETITAPVIATTTTKTCDSAFTLPDLTTLDACGDGKGHCYDEDKTAVPHLPACTNGKSGQVCVPDTILNANGGKLTPCTFFVGGKPGACMSVLVSDIAAHEDQLQKDVCHDDERCAPCIDPTNGNDTHVCEAEGVHERACSGGSANAAVDLCCHGAGGCLKSDGVPANRRDQMHQDVCDDGDLCAPASMINGQPVSCSALGLSGVCIDLCFAGMLQAAGHVLRGDCGPTEVCLPCAVGSGEGVPGC